MFHSGMVAHTCSAISRMLRQEDQEFEASLGYTVSSRSSKTLSTYLENCFLDKKLLSQG